VVALDANPETAAVDLDWLESQQNAPGDPMTLAETYVTASDEYAAFMKSAFNIDSRRIVVAESPGALPNAEAVVFFNAKGRIIVPPLIPCLPVKFNTTPTNKRARLDRMWLDCGGLLAQEFLKHGLGGQISLSPEITDLRPFLWTGFTLGLRYSFLVDFPYDETQMDSAVRKQIAKTASTGFVCRRGGKNEIAAIVECIRQTEQRQGFTYSVTQSILEKGCEILGDDKFRIYIATAPNGGIASCRVVLHATGGVAIDWIAATATEHLKSGATQVLIQFALQDLQASGATAFDFAGAGLPGVSAAKACWGGRLIAYGSLSRDTLKSLAARAIALCQKRDKTRMDRPERHSPKQKEAA
jgi:hypothetical protein